MKLTEAQKKTLISARDVGIATHHLRGRSAFGGWEKTRIALMKRGLLDQFLRITDAGRAALQKDTGK